jgi:predicted O-linked N-acetylglucosamine transferase (SPINDLY family)
MLKYHDATQFEVHVYQTYEQSDGITDTIKSSVPYFEYLHPLTFKQAAEKIHADGIDILIDLTGYTRSQKIDILAQQPAPIQCHLLGYPGTLGASFIQYYIHTRQVLTPDIHDYFKEQLVLLPETHIAREGFPTEITLPSKKEFNLPEDKFIFCYLGESNRIDQAVFSCWMTILKQVPNSVLWINLDLITETNENLLQHARQQGVGPERIIFKTYKRLSSDWHHGLADLWLDTFVISAGTSCILSTWFGLPVLTYPNNRPASRTAMSLLHAAGFTDTIVHSKEEYIQKAVFLAHHPEVLQSYREKLRTLRTTSSLFNTQRFIKHLESAYHAMWEDHRLGHPHRVLSIQKL